MVYIYFSRNYKHLDQNRVFFLTKKQHSNFDGKEESPTKICKEIESKQLVLYIVWYSLTV